MISFEYMDIAYFRFSLRNVGYFPYEEFDQSANATWQKKMNRFSIFASTVIIANSMLAVEIGN